MALLQWLLARLAGAVPSARKAPDPIMSFRVRGNAFLAAGDWHAAEQCYRHAIVTDPQDPLPYINLGYVLLHQHLEQEARATLEIAISMDPANADSHYLLGGIAERRFDFEAAAFHYQRSFKLNPELESACSDACRVLFISGRVTDASDLIAAGLMMNPTNEDFHYYQGNLLLADQKLDSALECYREALSLGADYPTLHGYIGGILVQKNELQSALVHLQRAIELDPNTASAHHDLGVVFHRLGEIKNAITEQELAISLRPDFLQAHSCLLFAMTLDSECLPQKYLNRACAYGVQVQHFTLSAQRLQTPPTIHEVHFPLRVGLVSGDFRMHPVGALLEAVFPHLPDSSLQIVAFSNNPYDDEVTDQLRSFTAEWHAISSKSDLEVATLIRSRQIDILIDLAGHTAHNRLPVFAWKPAQIQITWLGYLASTGMLEIDYLIADDWTLPESCASHFTEKVLRLPNSYLCFTPPSRHLHVTPLPASINGYVTFGCFNNLIKMNDDVVAIWARVLTAVPTSKLFLKAKQLIDSTTCQRVMERFALNGVNLNRLILEGPLPRSNYLTSFHQVDISLDTFPYPGVTTSIDSLWMGVPVLTLAGSSFLSRQGVGLLMNVGLPDWIAVDSKEYVERAVSFASDIPSLVLLRRTLRQRVLSSPLVDAQRFSDSLRGALHTLWETWRASHPVPFDSIPDLM